MKLSKIGLLGIISLLSYLAMVFFAPLAYPGYQWMSMAISDLNAVGAPSKGLAEQLNCLFAPCGLVSIMAVCVASANFRTKGLRIGIYLFAIMEWIVAVGYQMFPWISNAVGFNFQNAMHLTITVATVLLSIASLIFIIVGTRKGEQKALGTWAIICLTAMLAGAIGSNVLPKQVFGIAERFSTFSVVIYNAVLGYYLFRGRFDTVHNEM